MGVGIRLLYGFDCKIKPYHLESSLSLMFAVPVNV